MVLNRNHHRLVETKTIFYIVFYLILNFYLGGVNRANVMNNQNICHRDDKITSVWSVYLEGTFLFVPEIFLPNRLMFVTWSWSKSTISQDCNLGQCNCITHIIPLYSLFQIPIILNANLYVVFFLENDCQIIYKKKLGRDNYTFQRGGGFACFYWRLLLSVVCLKRLIIRLGINTTAA